MEIAVSIAVQCRASYNVKLNCMTGDSTMIVLALQSTHTAKQPSFTMVVNRGYTSICLFQLISRAMNIRHWYHHGSWAIKQPLANHSSTIDHKPTNNQPVDPADLDKCLPHMSLDATAVNEAAYGQICYTPVVVLAGKLLYFEGFEGKPWETISGLSTARLPDTRGHCI